ncbi:adenylate kinase family protein [Methanobacterium spitsbergense]|uniref:Putative adenylate kinase n=1 Tax=Methanobacterium spitsbergense TaxID=2874285 RepID=A0A8T5UXS0_9EURY|nr:adenylate kinase family protein [Methanobacterium spitsbergense]MBZ2165970.1 adenylate kinase family protein [Methanobacterium spitsbergense]
MTAVLITGTPGTGKTTVSRIVAEKLETSLLAVNDLVDEKHIYNEIDAEKGYKVVDLDTLLNEIKIIVENSDKDHIIVEGHLAHEFSSDVVDMVIVLRARPDILRKRLNKRGWSDSKVYENLEAEALDICTFEAVEIHGKKVNELDTSDINVEEVADIVIEIINYKKHFPPGNLNFLEELYGI